jgi:hypothetical protein
MSRTNVLSEDPADSSALEGGHGFAIFRASAFQIATCFVEFVTNGGDMRSDAEPAGQGLGAHLGHLVVLLDDCPDSALNDVRLVAGGADFPRIERAGHLAEYLDEWPLGRVVKLLHLLRIARLKRDAPHSAKLKRLLQLQRVGRQ